MDVSEKPNTPPTAVPSNITTNEDETHPFGVSDFLFDNFYASFYGFLPSLQMDRPEGVTQNMFILYIKSQNQTPYI